MATGPRGVPEATSSAPREERGPQPTGQLAPPAAMAAGAQIPPAAMPAPIPGQPPMQQAGGAAASYVRLRGLPFTATEAEVAQWFANAPGQPIQVLRVLFTFIATGKKSGEAYVELPEMMADRAVQVLNHRNMGTRYVEVFLSSEGEMSQASVAPPLANGVAPTWQPDGASGPGGIVRLRGLPFNATADLILQFFQGYDIPKGQLGVHLLFGPNGRPNGEGFVEFAADEVAEAALAKDRQTIGTRYVEVFRATPDQMAQALQRVAKSNNLAPMHNMQGGGGGGGGGMHPGAAMPYAFGPYGMQPQMMPGGMGGGSNFSGGGSDAVCKMRGLPYKVTRNDILDFFSGLSVPLNGVHLMFNDREQPTGEAYVEFSSHEDRERAMAKDRQHIGGRYVELFRVNRAEMLAALEQFVGGFMSNLGPSMGAMSLGGGGAAYGGMYGAMAPYGQPTAYMGGHAGAGGYSNMQQHMGGMHGGGMHGGGGPMGVNGAAKAGTLRMRGIPFRSTVEDVLRFFQGFQVVPGGVMIGQRDGRATGDCFVTFANPAEAQRAMALNNKHMGSRYVELFST